jgi:hypothetical protein
MNAKKLPTVYDGICFRSRLEATWYAFLKLLEFDMEHENQCFELDMGSSGLAKYLPDFYIPPHGSRSGLYVEVKPLRDEYDDRDKWSMLRAYVLGYSHPTAVILGDPRGYYCVICSARHKGSPIGHGVKFRCSGRIETVSEWSLLTSYPDECPDLGEADPRQDSGAVFVQDSYPDIALAAETATQWQPRRK